MDSVHNADRVIEVAELSVWLEREWRAASLRYLDPTGEFADRVRTHLGAPLPAPLRALAIPRGGAGELILAWRSPTETLLLCAGAAFAQFETQLAGAADGCMVDQSGGLWAVRVRGRRIGELLLRLGSTASTPNPGESRTSRLAELSVLALCVRAGEVLLLVERTYAEHLLGWIRETVADFS